MKSCTVAKVLVVDDDARNIFALATVLENHDMEVLTATNGRQAIDLIQNTPELNVVLYGHHDAPKWTAIRPCGRSGTKPGSSGPLPHCVALTAKAMKWRP